MMGRLGPALWLLWVLVGAAGATGAAGAAGTAGAVVAGVEGAEVSGPQLSDVNQDPATRQLPDFKETHKTPIGALTTSAGRPVDVRQTSTLNRELITNPFFIDTIESTVHERIPARVVFPKATGASGYLEVTNDITKYTSAKLFEKVGKKTPLSARFGVSSEQGGSDFDTLSFRSFSMKFYTEDGNLDLLNIQIPVYLYTDPITFANALRALRRNPSTNLRDPTTALDLVLNNPIALHGALWLTSSFALPRGYRKMNVFPIHVFQLNNEQGESFFVKFKFLTEQGFDSFSLKEARTLSAIDPDFFMRDLYNAIKLKKYPSWKMEMDVMTQEDVKNANFNPFDVTTIWPNGTYHTVPIGRVVLNRNPENQFAEVEQLALNPSNLVPGITGPVDQLFKGRVIAYTATQIYRLGVNRNKIEVNCPRYAKTYNRDGRPPTRENMRDAPNYFPNSYNGPVPIVDQSMPEDRVRVMFSTGVDLKSSAYFYNYVLNTDKLKNQLVTNLAQLTSRANKEARQKFVQLLTLADRNLGARMKEAYLAADQVKMPSMVEDIPKTE